MNWIHVLAGKDALEGENVTKICKANKRRYLRGFGARPGRGSSSFKSKKKVNKLREPEISPGVQELEDARTSHPCERRAGNCKATCSCRRGEIPKLAGTPFAGFAGATFIQGHVGPASFVRRCVMSPDKPVKAEPCAGTFNVCLVEGNAEEHEKKIKRRAIAISVALQSLGLAALVIAPLFAKPAELTERFATPIPPYRHIPAQRHASQVSNNRPRFERSAIFALTNISPIIQTQDEAHPPGDTVDLGEAIELPGTSTGPIDIVDTRPQPKRPDEPPREKRRVHLTEIDPALLIRRVEPVYPILARQLRKNGKVELHAVITTDGSIQSLEIVSGDPLFINSAREAVLQWRYRPTYLNGQAVEIDTYITVIYTLP
jgi:periplasmic protein TonB